MKKYINILMVTMMATVCITFMTACGGSDDDPLDNRNPVSNNTGNNNGNASGGTGGDNAGGQASQGSVTFPDIYTAFGADYETVVSNVKNKGFVFHEKTSSKEFVYFSNQDQSMEIVYAFLWYNDVSELTHVYVYWNHTTMSDALWVKSETEKRLNVSLDDEKIVDYGTLWGGRAGNIAAILSYNQDTKITFLILGGGV